MVSLTNQQIISNLVKIVSGKIEWRMEDFEETYEQAKEWVKDKTVAGPAVWEILDEKYSK